MGHYRFCPLHTITGTVVENVDTDVMDVADNAF